MSNKLTLRNIGLEWLNRILNPNFESKFIWILLITGISLIGYQRVLQLVSTVEFLSQDMYLKLALSSGTDVVFVAIGVLFTLISCVLFYLRHYRSKEDKPLVYKTLRKAAPAIRPLLDENRRLFMTFGPNSTAENITKVRQSMDLWENAKRSQIVPNNDRIYSLINSVPQTNLKQKEQLAVSDMKSHIEAFKEHCNNPQFDYSEHQFPLSFSDLIYSYCSCKNNNIDKYERWLRDEAFNKNNKIESLFIYGSALYGQETVDVDIIIKTNVTSIEEAIEFSEECNEIATRFSEKFGLKLHTKVFSELETEHFQEFIKKLQSSKKVL